MVTYRIDALARELCRAETRRGFLRAVGGAAAALLVGRPASPRPAAAYGCDSNSDCSAGQRCCFGICASVSYDSFNCGRCGRICLSSETCRSGSCRGSSWSSDDPNSGWGDSGGTTAPPSSEPSAPSSGSPPVDGTGDDRRVSLLGIPLGLGFGALAGGYVGGTLPAATQARKVGGIVGAVALALLLAIEDWVPEWLRVVSFVAFVGLLVACYLVRRSTTAPAVPSTNAASANKPVGAAARAGDPTKPRLSQRSPVPPRLQHPE